MDRGTPIRMVVNPEGQSSMKLLFAALGATLALACGASPALAADVHVETSGSDAPGCGSVGTPCLSIPYAVGTIAGDGDSVLIGAGTFPVTSNALIVDKSLTITGAGIDQTIIDGQNANTLTQAGMFRPSVGGGTPRTVSFSNFTGINLARAGAATSGYLIFANAGHHTLDLNVTDVKVIGYGTGSPYYSTAVSPQANYGDVHIDGLDVEQSSGNSIYFDRQKGDLIVENSTIEQASGVGSSAIHGWSFGGSSHDVTGDFIFRDNTIVGNSGIGIYTGYSYCCGSVTPASYLGAVTIERNSFTATTASSGAITINNVPFNASTPTTATVNNVTIEDNTLTGTGTGTGIRLTGKVDNSQVTHNSVRNYTTGISLGNGLNPAEAPSGTVLTANQIARNRPNPSTELRGLNLGSNASNITANENWWGCNAGPAITTTPTLLMTCDPIIGLASQITLDNWVVMGLSANPDTNLAYQGSADVNVDFLELNNGDPAPAIFTNGTIVPLSATMGTLDDSNPTLTGNETEAEFTSFWRTGRSVTATFDGQVSTHSWATDTDPLDLYVEKPGNGGIDSPTCGPLPHPPCETIAQAVANSLTGDRIFIGDGTWVITQSINPGGKSLEFIGNGPANTEISGGDSNSFPSGGVFRFQTPGTEYVVRDLSISHLPSTTGSGTPPRFGIWVQPVPQAEANAIDATIDNVHFNGGTGSPVGAENAVYAASNSGSLSITDSMLTNVMGNSILLEQQSGEVLIDGNTIIKPLSSTSAVIFDWLHASSGNAQSWNQVGEHTITNNTFDTASGVALLAGYPYHPTSFGPSTFGVGVTISGNTFNKGGASGNSISATNADRTNAGTAGEIHNLVIESNTVNSTSGGNGVNLSGGVIDPQITNNVIRNTNNGVLLRRFTSSYAPTVTFDHVPTGTTINNNQIVDNTSGVTTDSGASISANLNGNWWGCNEGPEVAAAPTPGDCDYVTNALGTMTVDNWTVLGIDATPASELSNNGVATVTTGFDELNTGGASSTPFADGTVVPMSSTGGSLATPTPTLTSLLTTNTFTSNTFAGRSASATFDHETVTHIWNNDVTPPNVTITAPANGLITNVSSVTVNYTVTDFGGGVTCNIADGGSVPLTYGANTIVVACTDAAGNTGYDSVAVIYDNVPPTVTIDSPADNSYTTASAVNVLFTAEDEYGVASCTRTNGQSAPLVSGPNTISVSCTDLAGNTGNASITVTRDNVVPVVQITSPANNSSTYDPDVVVNFTVVDSSPTTCTPLDGATVPLNYGPNTIVVTCTDAAGNQASDSVNVTRLAPVPVVDITAPADNSSTTNPTTTVNYTATDPSGGGLTCTLADGAVVPLSFGPNTIVVECTDQYNNTGSDSVTVTRTDNVAPVVTITAPTNGLITANSSVTLSYTVTDDTATTCNLADGASVPLNAGSNTITVVCTDAYGNVGFASVSVIRDNNAPAVTIVSPPDGTITNAASTTINFSVINDYGSVTCDHTDGQSVALAEGANTIEVECTDQAGNVGSDSITVTRDSTPPAVTITAPADGSSTTDASVVLDFTVTDATATSCSPTDGSTVNLAYGSNVITVTCTDAAGNVGTDSVTVTRSSTTPPVVTITSPAAGAIIRSESTTLTYAAASDHGTVSCTPPSGSSVALAIGVNKITVNCTDSFGNVASASVTVYRPDTLPACAKDIAITDVTRVGSRSRIRGIARIQYVGQKIKLQYQPSGSKTVGTATVLPDGSWSAVVKRSSKPAWTSNQARYRATLSKTTTSWIKLSRRMGATAVTYDGNGRLKVTGSVALPIAKGQPLRVERSDACGAYRQIGSIRVNKDGTFSGTVPSGGGSDAAVYIRLKARVAKASNPSFRFNTYSIVQPVVVER